MFHKHAWEVASKEFVSPISHDVGSFDARTDQAAETFRKMIQGYWTYTLRCAKCGSVEVRSS